MAESVRQAGQYILESFKISRLNEPDQFIDIKLLIHEWDLTESMEFGHLLGSASVLDGSGLLEDFLDEGLRGEEEIEITYRDWYDEQITHKMFLYAITDVKVPREANDTFITYTIFFASKDKFLTERTYLRRAFTEEKISDYVQLVYDEYYLEFNDEAKPITIEETDGDQYLVVPYYSPEQTMHFLARRAYSAENDTQTFRFFENKKGYYFVTHEKLWQDSGEIPKFIRIAGADSTPEGQELLMKGIIDIEYPNYINTFNDLNNAAYYSYLTELDYINRTLLTTPYQYLDEYSEYDLPGGKGNTMSKHSKAFVDEHLKYPRERYVLKDYPTEGQASIDSYLRPDTFYPQIYNKKTTNFYHHRTNAVSMKIYGRTSLNAGDFVEIELLKINSNAGERKIDEKKSGIYLVESIKNVFYENTYYQALTMSKSGFTGAPEPADEYDTEPQEPSVFTEQNSIT